MNEAKNSSSFDKMLQFSIFDCPEYIVLIEVIEISLIPIILNFKKYRYSLI